MYLCLCSGISESRVSELGRRGILCPNELVRALCLDSAEGCGRCLEDIEDFLEVARQAAAAAGAADEPAKSRAAPSRP